MTQPFESQPFPDEDPIFHDVAVILDDEMEKVHNTCIPNLDLGVSPGINDRAGASLTLAEVLLKNDIRTPNELAKVAIGDLLTLPDPLDSEDIRTIQNTLQLVGLQLDEQ